VKILIFACLFLVACERDPSLDEPPADARPTTPDTDATPTDAGPVTRPGAGPLDPDEVIDCETTSYYQASLDAVGRETTRTYPGRAIWSGTALPQAAWTCGETPYEPLNCYGNTETCAIRGAEYAWRTKCLQSIWQVDIEGRFYVYCGTRVQHDPDGDGVFEDAYPGLFTRQHVAVVY
jgi:hypothetical protein